MRFMIALSLLWTIPAFACWNLQGVLKVDKQEVKINQRVAHDRTYSFQSGDYIFNLKVPSSPTLPKHLSQDDNWNEIKYEIVEKVSNKLNTLSKGHILVKESEMTTHTQEHFKTKKLTTITVKLSNI